MKTPPGTTNGKSLLVELYATRFELQNFSNGIKHRLHFAVHILDSSQNEFWVLQRYFVVEQCIYRVECSIVIDILSPEPPPSCAISAGKHALPGKGFRCLSVDRVLPNGAVPGAVRQNARGDA